MCVCLLLQDLVQSCLRGEGGILEDMCYERRRAERGGRSRKALARPNGRLKRWLRFRGKGRPWLLEEECLFNFIDNP